MFAKPKLCVVLGNTRCNNAPAARTTTTALVYRRNYSRSVTTCGLSTASFSRSTYWPIPVLRGPLMASSKGHQSDDGDSLAERARELRDAQFQGGVVWMSDGKLIDLQQSPAHPDESGLLSESDWGALADLREACRILPVEAHLYCSAAAAVSSMHKLANVGLDCVTLHAEALLPGNDNGGSEYSKAADIAATLRFMKDVVPNVSLAVLPSLNPDRLILELASKGALPDRISVLMADPLHWEYLPSMEGKLRHIRALLMDTGCSVCAIGGINTHNAAFVARAGAQEVTVLDLARYEGEDSCALRGTSSCGACGHCSLAATVRQDLMSRWASAARVEQYLNRILF